MEQNLNYNQNFRYLNVVLINKLIEKNNTSSKSDLLFKKFIQELYSIAIPEMMVDVNNPEEIENIYTNTLKCFEFIKNRKFEEIKIRIYDSENHLENKNIKYSIIEILNDDKPFLLDSLKNFLDENSIKIYETIHPIMQVERDDKGQLLNLVPYNADKVKTKTRSESLIQFYVNRITNHLNLETELKNILENVKVLVEDWQLMLEKLKTVIENYRNNNLPDKYINFLTWLIEDNFTFFGYRKLNFKGQNIDFKPSEEKLGFIKTNYLYLNELLETEANKITQLKDNHRIVFGRFNVTSLIHRKTHLEYICLKTYDSKNQLLSLEFFIGLFTTNLNYQSVNTIPLIKEKIQYALDNSGFLPASYSRKELLSIFESLPREELLQFDKEQLFFTSMSIYNLTIKPKLKLFMRKDYLNNLLSCMIFIPRENFSAEICDIIVEKLQKAIGGIIIDRSIQLSNLPLAYVYLVINSENINIETINSANIETKLEKLLNIWTTNFKNDIAHKFDPGERKHIFDKYKSAFANSYKEKPRIPGEIAQDIKYIEESISLNKTIFKIVKSTHEEIVLKIYNYQKKIDLSEIMPILDNIGFNVIDESTFCIDPQDLSELYLHEFRINISGYENLTISELKEFEIYQIMEIKDYIEEALCKIWHKEIQNDSLNKLIVRGGFAWREVVLIRALTKYMRQTGIIYGNEYIEEVLTKHPKLVKNLVEVFFLLFDPNIERSKKHKNNKDHLIDIIFSKLSKIHVSAEDKIIRRLFEIIRATLRTNYFQLNNEGDPKDYISFKFDSAKIPELPLPLPFREIFVYSPRIEGIHLRGGKVARGGLRWSDRSEDFRTEVLGLMKAQMTKNAVIVPVGSKGGFVVKSSITTLGREEYIKEGKECYKTFLRGLLDVTDNIINDECIRPENVVCYDEDDPYLVVAADKGTATFSDIANSISAEYSFWLGDAFASGGSDGYDHKKMAITAKGAWISVMRHFNQLGIDAENNNFSVIGIGDMSGDVFGNGMLLSKNIKLLGAFNHLHIFIDPNPDAKISYQERERLFKLPTSNWTDYDKSLISEGGGIFERSAKSIKLSKEAQELLLIEQDEITPDELIKKFLTAKVDLLWNGGIGTYVKAIEESNLQVGDKNNDNVRINGSDLNCCVVGEGGNLGFTQKGRIEYALKGGLSNTDAIDNSAGVDCSDHEVNIKIAFGKAIEQKKISISERNKLLEKMTDEVAKLVLRDNELQTQAITLMEKQGYEVLEMNERLINSLESKGMLNREVEFLPSKTEIARRKIAKLGLTRPEIAVLLAYSKLTIYKDLIESNLPDDPYFQEDLALYFPKIMSDIFKEEINNHPLKREIITTSVTNSMVNRIGNFFFHFALEDTGLKGCDIARAYSLTRDIFDLRIVWREIESYDGKIDLNYQVELFMQINKLVQRSVFWFLRNTKQLVEVTGIVNNFKPGISELTKIIDKILVGDKKEKYLTKLANYQSMNIKNDLAVKIAKISVLASSCDIVSISIKNNLSIKTVGSIYYQIGKKFKFDLLSNALDNIKSENYWQRLSIKSLKDELYDQYRVLTNKVLKYVTTDKNPIEFWCNTNAVQVERYKHFIDDLFLYEILDESMVNIAIKRINLLLD